MAEITDEVNQHAEVHDAPAINVGRGAQPHGHRRRPDKCPAALAAFNPAVVLQVVERPPNRRPAQARQTGELMIRQKRIADLRAGAEKMADQLVAAPVSRLAGRQRKLKLDGRHWQAKSQRFKRLRYMSAATAA